MAKQEREVRCLRCRGVLSKEDRTNPLLPGNYHSLCYRVVLSELELKHGQCCICCVSYITFASTGGRGRCINNRARKKAEVGASRESCPQFARKTDALFREEKAHESTRSSAEVGAPGDPPGDSGGGGALE